jgi:hypothetical protein
MTWHIGAGLSLFGGPEDRTTLDVEHGLHGLDRHDSVAGKTRVRGVHDGIGLRLWGEDLEMSRLPVEIVLGSGTRTVDRTQPSLPMNYYT